MRFLSIGEDVGGRHRRANLEATPVRIRRRWMVWNGGFLMFWYFKNPNDNLKIKMWRVHLIFFNSLCHYATSGCKIGCLWHYSFFNALKFMEKLPQHKDPKSLTCQFPISFIHQKKVSCELNIFLLHILILLWISLLSLITPKKIKNKKTTAFR